MVGTILYVFLAGTLIAVGGIVAALFLGWERFVAAVDWVNGLIGKVFAWAVLVLTVAICYEVFMRYVMRSPTAWAYDLSYMLYGTLFMTAGAYALSTAGHVRGDVIYRLFPIRTQGWIDLVLYVTFFFPAIIALIYAGYIYAEYSWRIGERSAASPGGPPVYHFKTVIPVTAALLYVQGMAEVIRCIECIRTGRWPARPEDVADIDPELIAAYGGHASVDTGGGARPPRPAAGAGGAAP